MNIRYPELKCTEENDPRYRALEYQFNQALQFIVNNTSSDKQDVVIAALPHFTRQFQQLADNQDSPNEYFPYIASGAFKECYASWIPGWIIKFASTENNTHAEKIIPHAAEQIGIGYLFLPTFYVDLPFLLSAHHLDEYDKYASRSSDEYNLYPGDAGDGDGDEYHTALCTMLIQPEVIVQSHIDYECIQYLTEEAYNLFPIKNALGEPLPYRAIEEATAESREWIEAVIQYWGDIPFRKMCDFFTRFNIHDLATRNLGYIKDVRGQRPIILDWLSRDIHPSVKATDLH